MLHGVQDNLLWCFKICETDNILVGKFVAFLLCFFHKEMEHYTLESIVVNIFYKGQKNRKTTRLTKCFFQIVWRLWRRYFYLNVFGMGYEMRKCVCVREGVGLVKRMEEIIGKMFKDQRILATTRMIRLFIFTKRST